MAIDAKPKIRYQGRIRPCREVVCCTSQPLSRPVPMASSFATVIITSYRPPIMRIISTLAVPYIAPTCWVKNFSTSAAMVFTMKIRPRGPSKWPKTSSFLETARVVVPLSSSWVLPLGSVRVQCVPAGTTAVREKVLSRMSQRQEMVPQGVFMLPSAQLSPPPGTGAMRNFR